MYPGLTYDEQIERVKQVCSTFPATFGLRAFPGDVFRVEPRDSYIHDTQGYVVLYTHIKKGDMWSGFAKGTEQELRAQMVSIEPIKIRQKSHSGPRMNTDPHGNGGLW